MNIQVGLPVENKRTTLVGEVLEIEDEMVKVHVDLTDSTELWMLKDVIGLASQSDDKPLSRDARFFVHDIRKVLDGYMVQIEYERGGIPGTIDITTRTAPGIGQMMAMTRRLAKQFPDERYVFWWEHVGAGAVFHFVLEA